MPNLLTLIKQAAVEAVEEAAPCALLFGTVAEAEPLSVRVAERLTVSAPLLVRAETSRPLERGEDVLVLRAQGGARYAVLGRVT